ncbi:MAG: hypothetical protein IPK26_06310 [Planctomycetes bacterium]|nr:hypothetical protein [Planctomycetota bacterium]
MRPTVPLRLLPLWCLSPLVLAQNHMVWEPVLSPVSPPARWGHSLCAAPGTGDPLVFGGRDATAAFADVWTFGRNGWQVRPVANGPSARHGHAMVIRVDVIVWRTEAVLFGGAAANGSLLGDSWVLTESGGVLGWRQLPASGGPSPRVDHAMVFADAANVSSGNVETVVFGGRTASGTSADSFALRGDRWVVVGAGARRPAPRVGARLLDTADGLRLLGGHDGGVAFTDEWLLHNGTWTPAGNSPTGLAGAVDAALSFERLGHLLLLAEDTAGIQAVRERTHQGVWLDPVVSGNMPPRRAGAAIRWLDHLSTPAGSEICEMAMAFGGRGAQGQALADTWRLRPQHVAYFEALGGGCGPGPWGPNGPAIMIGKATIGRSSFQRLYSVSPQTPAALAIGRLDTALPTCGLRLDPVVLDLFVTDAVGMAERTVPVPPLAVLAGLPFDFQGAALEAGAAAGIAFSGVTRLWLGD